MGKNERYEITALNGRKLLDIRYSAFDCTFEFAFEGADLRSGVHAYAFRIFDGSTTLDVHSPETLKSAEVRKLIHTTSVANIVVSASHVMEMTLSNGIKLSFPTHDDFEGWTLSWQGGVFASAPPGGKSLDWPPKK